MTDLPCEVEKRDTGWEEEEETKGIIKKWEILATMIWKDFIEEGTMKLVLEAKKNFG